MSACSLIAAVRTAAIFEYQGTIHSCISFVVGSRLGGCASIVYCFAQAVSCALHALGFAECVHGILDSYHFSLETFVYTRQAIAVMLLLLLLVINLAGIKWVLRLQFVLLVVLLLCVLDFAAGVCRSLMFPVAVIPAFDLNFTGNTTIAVQERMRFAFDWLAFQDLLWPAVGSQVSWCTALGVFYPAVTGVFAGLNMSADLRKPSKSVPLGTYSALGAAVIVYLLLLFGLASVCPRSLLLSDQLIIKKVSLIRWFLLLGIYVSTVSASLGKFRS